MNELDKKKINFLPHLFVSIQIFLTFSSRFCFCFENLCNHDVSEQIVEIVISSARLETLSHSS